jgi:undecaprenyl-phosphate galactose phosphotransferase
LGILLALFDLLALLLAIFVAHIQLVFFSQLFPFGYDTSYAPWTERLYPYGLLSLALIIAMANKGHYSQRIPWWGQVQFMLKAVAIGFILDGFSYFSLQVPFSRLYVALNWLNALFLLIFLRRIALNIISREREWKLPVIPRQ